MLSQWTVVVPVYQDDDALSRLLALLNQWSVLVVVVDGAQDPATQKLVDTFAGKARYLAAAPGRGEQIAAGIENVSTPWVWVLHADTLPSRGACEFLAALDLADGCYWGRFDIVMSGLPVICWFMNWRSRLSKICTGDQGMFFAIPLLQAVGGFPRQPLMEDIEVSRLLKHSGGCFLAPKHHVEASGRRWFTQGKLKTVLSMWFLRLRYWCGADVHQLYRAYYGKSL